MAGDLVRSGFEDLLRRAIVAKTIFRLSSVRKRNETTDPISVLNSTQNPRTQGTRANPKQHRSELTDGSLLLRRLAVQREQTINIRDDHHAEVGFEGAHVRATINFIYSGCAGRRDLH